jgi:putative peptide zinc metalloprotease protein
MRQQLRLRPDLVFNEQRQAEYRVWVVKDPVAMAFFQFSEDEHFLLRCFDGRRSLQVIKSLYDQSFAPRRVSTSHLWQFAVQLSQWGLLLSDTEGQGTVLWRRARRLRRARIWQTWTNPLAIRLPSWNADPFMRLCDRVGRIIFDPRFILAAAGLAVCAVLLLVGQASRIIESSPVLETVFVGDNLLWLALSMGAVKICHELGHGLACRYCGAQCGEMGVMLLAFVPCLYCDVTDAWLLPSKWSRIAVSCAGIYVELIIATIAVFVWYFSEPGLLNTICLNTILVCSVGTLLFNANPLLRYDGYYVLSDLAGVPNLQQRAREAIWGPIKDWWAMRVRSGDRPRIGWLPAYGLSCMVYRLLVVSGILWIIYRMLASWHLRPVGDVIVATTCLGLVCPPAVSTTQWIRQVVRSSAIRWWRLACSTLVLGVFGLLALMYPLRRDTLAQAVVQAEDASQVYVKTEGRLVESVQVGAQVSAGQVIARLQNDRLELRLAQIDAQMDQLQRRLSNLRLQANDDESVLSRIPAVESELRDVQSRRAAIARELADLSIVAPIDGTVIPPPAKPMLLGVDELPAWSGTPLDLANRGCSIDRGELLCSIGPPDQFEVVLIFAPQDIEFVRLGQSVRIRFDAIPPVTWRGELIEFSEGESLPRHLQHVTIRHPRMTGPGDTASSDVWYFGRVRLYEQPNSVRHGFSGQAKVETGTDTIAGRIASYLASTFRFRL